LKARPRTSRSVALRKRQQLLDQLPDLREVLRGSLITRYRRCGRSNCHCARPGDPGHGPAYSLMVTVTSGKTLEVYVTREQKADVEAWISNFNKAREILEEISSINRRLLQEKRLFPHE
jgi:hypothetical protein